MQFLFLEILSLCREAGLLNVGRLALDGTKIKANASRHKAMSYDRMTSEEERLQKEIDELLKQAQATDQANDSRQVEPMVAQTLDHLDAIGVEDNIGAFTAPTRGTSARTT